jgi:hypothetical protein
LTMKERNGVPKRNAGPERYQKCEQQGRHAGWRSSKINFIVCT